MRDFLKGFYEKCDLDVSIVDIPLVFFIQGEVHEGFIPGFVMESIKKNNLQDCENELLEYAKKEISKHKKQNKMLPNFPTNEQIVEDFNPQKIKRFSFRI